MELKHLHNFSLRFYLESLVDSLIRLLFLPVSADSAQIRELF